MHPTIKARIELNHAMAAAMLTIVCFAERPDFLGGPLTVSAAIDELVRQGSYGVTREQLVSEYARVTKITEI